MTELACKDNRDNQFQKQSSILQINFTSKTEKFCGKIKWKREWYVREAGKKEKEEWEENKEKTK